MMYSELIFDVAIAKFSKNVLFESYLLFSGLKSAIAPLREKLLKVCHAKNAVGNTNLLPKFQAVDAFLSYGSDKL